MYAGKHPITDKHVLVGKRIARSATEYQAIYKS